MGRRTDYADGTWFSRNRMGDPVAITKGDERHRIAMEDGSHSLLRAIATTWLARCEAEMMDECE